MELVIMIKPALCGPTTVGTATLTVFPHSGQVDVERAEALAGAPTNLDFDTFLGLETYHW
jgi:hypothetical protein